jgi:hypothetical protein
MNKVMGYEFIGERIMGVHLLVHAKISENASAPTLRKKSNLK